MSAELMNFSQAGTALPGSVDVPRGQVRRIVGADHARWLAVSHGQLWITTEGDGERDGADVWLGTGQALALGEGVAALVEARVDAALQIVEAGPASQRSPAANAWQRVARWAWQGRVAMQLGAPAQPVADFRA